MSDTMTYSIAISHPLDLSKAQQMHAVGAKQCKYILSLRHAYLWGAATNGTGGLDTLADLHRSDGRAAFLAARAPGW